MLPLICVLENALNFIALVSSSGLSGSFVCEKQVSMFSGEGQKSLSQEVRMGRRLGCAEVALFEGS